MDDKPIKSIVEIIREVKAVLDERQNAEPGGLTSRMNNQIENMRLLGYMEGLSDAISLITGQEMVSKYFREKENNDAG